MVRRGPDGSFWVLDTSVGRLTRFNSEGEYVESIPMPARSFGLLGDDGVVVPVGIDTVAALVIIGDSVSPLKTTSSPFHSHRALTSVSVATLPEWGLVLWNNVEGGLWTRSLDVGTDGELSLVEVPEWFLAKALEKQRQRAVGLDVPASKNVVVPLVQSMHAVEPDRVCGSRPGGLTLLGLPCRSVTGVGQLWYCLPLDESMRTWWIPSCPTTRRWWLSIRPTFGSIGWRTLWQRRGSIQTDEPPV